MRQDYDHILLCYIEIILSRWVTFGSYFSQDLVFKLWQIQGRLSVWNEHLFWLISQIDEGLTYGEIGSLKQITDFNHPHLLMTSGHVIFVPYSMRHWWDHFSCIFFLMVFICLSLSRVSTSISRICSFFLLTRILGSRRLFGNMAGPVWVSRGIWPCMRVWLQPNLDHSCGRKPDTSGCLSEDALQILRFWQSDVSVRPSHWVSSADVIHRITAITILGSP